MTDIVRRTNRCRSFLSDAISTMPLYFERIINWQREKKSVILQTKRRAAFCRELHSRMIEKVSAKTYIDISEQKLL